MSRPGSSQRPTHIPLPPSGFTGRSPNGSPGITPASPTSPRSSFLPSFMRTRSRAATFTNSGMNAGRAASPSVETPNPIGGSLNRNTAHGRDVSSSAVLADGGGVTRSVSSPIGEAPVGPFDTEANDSSAQAPSRPQTSNANNTTVITDGSAVKTYRIRLVPHLETSRSLAFDPVVREMLSIAVPSGASPSTVAAGITNVGQAVNGRPPAVLLKIGRFTDKTPAAHSGHANGASGSNGTAGIAPSLTIAGGGGDVCSGKVAFKSKVVSRSHAEIWCEENGKFYIRDTASSSGTFLNHIRLSSPNTESRPTAINDGDVLQLGVDYQGGHEDMFRCVKMRVELGREWQRAANEFNTNALKQLKALGGALPDVKGKTTDSPAAPGKKGKSNVTDCCICLFSVTVCQSLFIAPCSHVFHYKCIRPLLMQHHPGFSCPLCRTFANLEEDVETEDAWEIASRKASVISRRGSNHSLKLPSPDRADSAADATGQPSTSIAVGQGASSIDHLLVDNANEVRMEGSSQLQRQDTAVPEPTHPTHHPGSDINMPSPVQEEGESEPVTATFSAMNPFAEPSVSFVPGAMSVPMPPGDPFLGGSLSQVQTPMNDTFLSTLAPSMHQRLDMANQFPSVREEQEAEPEREDGRSGASDNGSGSGSGSGAGHAEVSGEGEGTRRGSEEEWLRVDRETTAAGETAVEANGNANAEANGDANNERPELEMMFT